MKSSAYFLSYLPIKLLVHICIKSGAILVSKMAIHQYCSRLADDTCNMYVLIDTHLITMNLRFVHHDDNVGSTSRKKAHQDLWFIGNGHESCESVYECSDRESVSQDSCLDEW